jgi:hypothetical protein
MKRIQQKPIRLENTFFSLRRDIKLISSWKTTFFPCQKKERKEKWKKEKEKKQTNQRVLEFLLYEPGGKSQSEASTIRMNPVS